MSRGPQGEGKEQRLRLENQLPEHEDTSLFLSTFLALHKMIPKPCTHLLLTLDMHGLNGIGLVRASGAHKYVVRHLALEGVNQRLAVFHVLAVIIVNNVKGTSGEGGGVSGVAPGDGNAVPVAGGEG